MKIGPKPDIPPAVAPASTAGAGASSAAASAQASQAAQSSQAAQTTQNAQKSAATAVTVSSLARSIEESGASGSFDAKKVESVRTAIANGTYKVDAEAIADKLLSNARQVLRKSSEA